MDIHRAVSVKSILAVSRIQILVNFNFFVCYVKWELTFSSGLGVAFQRLEKVLYKYWNRQSKINAQSCLGSVATTATQMLNNHKCDHGQIKTYLIQWHQNFITVHKKYWQKKKSKKKATFSFGSDPWTKP